MNFTNFAVLFHLPQIYTEWANYYLERAKSKRTVADLSTDCRDGLLLAEVIEAVTSFKVPDLIKKPKTQQQMVSFMFHVLNEPSSPQSNGKFMESSYNDAINLNWSAQL